MDQNDAAEFVRGESATLDTSEPNDSEPTSEIVPEPTPRREIERKRALELIDVIEYFASDRRRARPKTEWIDELRKIVREDL